MMDWGPRMGNHDKIPSRISYSACSEQEEQQWGLDISADAVVMVNTKLELDLQDNLADELDLILRSLDGMSNLTFEHIRQSEGDIEYTPKSPADVVADYLEKVFEHLDKEMDWFGAELKAKLPVDIVITVPVVGFSADLPSKLQHLRSANLWATELVISREERYPTSRYPSRF